LPERAVVSDTLTRAAQLDNQKTYQSERPGATGLVGPKHKGRSHKPSLEIVKH